MKRLENRFVNITADDLLSAAHPLGTQRISGSSDVVAEYESECAREFGCSHAVAVCSGTVSIYCALRALGIGPGDEVILPPTAVVMSGLPVRLLGAEVIFADTTEEPGFGLDPDATAAAITPRTRAVISVPLWGYPVPMNNLVSVCENARIALIEDIAQAHGTTWNGQRLGTFGTIGCASTHERKLITTGEGGFVLTNDEKLAHRVATIKRYGVDETGAGTSLGYNFKLSGIAASLGRTQIRKLAAKIDARHRVARLIQSRLVDLDWLAELPVAVGSRQNYYSMVMLLTDPMIDVKRMDQHLADNNVISDTWRYGFRPLYEYPLFAANATHCPNGESLISRAFTLPCHEGMDEGDVEQVVGAVRSFTP